MTDKPPVRWAIQKRLDTAWSEVKGLQVHQRRVYLIALACAVPILLLSRFGAAADDYFLQYGYPVAALLFAALFITLWRKWVTTRIVEMAAITIAAILILGRLAWHFFIAESVDGELIVLVGGHYWAVGVLIVAAFVILGQKIGQLTAAAVLTVAIVIALAGMGGELLAGEVASETLIYLIRVHLFLLILLVLASGGTIMRDRMELAVAQADMLNHLARTDSLSGLPNRRGGQEFLHQTHAAAERYGQTFSIISADIDHFKQVNDQYGHTRGDEVIQGLSRILLETVRESDRVIRWGGEEFLIVTPQTSLSEASRLAERCRNAAERTSFNGIGITLSLGVAQFRPGQSLDAIITRADDMLYRAKASGRNVVIAERLSNADAPESADSA